MSYITEYLRFSLQIFRMNDVSCHDTTDDSISVKKSLFDISKSNESKNPRIIIFPNYFKLSRLKSPRNRFSTSHYAICYSGYWFLPQRLTRSSHSKYSAAKSEIKGAIILIRRKLFPSGGMTAYRGINGQLFAADLLSLSCATTRVSVSYLPRFFHSTWWRTTRTVACSADNRGWPG